MSAYLSLPERAKRDDAVQAPRRPRGRRFGHWVLAALPVLGLFGLAAWAGGLGEKTPLTIDHPKQGPGIATEPPTNNRSLACERAMAELKLREAELQEAQALLAAATTRLERPVHLETPLAEAEVALAKLETQRAVVPLEIRLAQARLDSAKRNHEAKTALKGVVAGHTIDEAAGELAEAAISLEEQQARRDLLAKERETLVAYRDALKMQLQLKVDEIQAKRVADAKLEAARARLAQAEIQLAEIAPRPERMATDRSAEERALGEVRRPRAGLSDEPADPRASETSRDDGTFAGPLGDGH